MKVVPHPKFKRDYRGRRVRTVKELSNAWGSIPAGTLAVVRYQGPKGSTLAADKCPGCGVSLYISAVQPSDIEFVEERGA